MLCISLMEKFWKSEHILCNFLMYSGAFITQNWFSLLREIIKIQRNRISKKETLNASWIIFHLSCFWSIQCKIKKGHGLGRHQCVQSVVLVPCRIFLQWQLMQVLNALKKKILHLGSIQKTLLWLRNSVYKVRNSHFLAWLLLDTAGKKWSVWSSLLE